jgi:hypothetical protein
VKYFWNKLDYNHKEEDNNV